MILWMILTVMVALAAVGLTIPLVRRLEAHAPRDGLVEVLKAQLADIDAQIEAGTVTAEEAEGLKTEVKRRLLTEAREAPAASRPLGGKALVQLAFGLVAILAIAATALYAKLGRPDLGTGGPVATAAPTGDHPGGGDVSAMIGQLETKLKQSPNDAKGWALLAWSYFQTDRFAEAANAYGRAAALEPGNSEHLSAQGDALVRASGGQITPAAVEAFKKAVAISKDDPRARYFLAAAKDQAGDHKGAIDDWIELLKSAPAGAGWVPEVRASVERIAQERGIDISKRLPPAPAASGGPDAAQVAAMNQMSPADRQATINNMVEGLAAKLKANPKDAAGWAKLMNARMVLGQTDKAAEAYRDAQKAFAGSPTELGQLQAAAKQMGVPGA